MSIISKNNTNHKVVKMNEIEKRKVVEHNDLISSVAKMDKTPLKIFELAVSCIDTENPPKDNIIYLSKKNFSDFSKSQTMINIVDLSMQLKSCKSKPILISDRIRN